MRSFTQNFLYYGTDSRFLSLVSQVKPVGLGLVRTCTMSFFVAHGCWDTILSEPSCVFFFFFFLPGVCRVVWTITGMPEPREILHKNFGTRHIFLFTFAVGVIMSHYDLLVRTDNASPRRAICHVRQRKIRSIVL